MKATQATIKTAVSTANNALSTVAPSGEIIQRLEIPALPPTLNELLAAGKSPLAGSGQWKLSALKREWTSDIEALAATLKPYSKDRVWLDFTWYVAFYRDFDNLHTGVKFILDGLANAGIIKNDNLVTIQSPVTHWHERTSKGKERVDLVIANTPRYVAQKWQRYYSAIADSLDMF